jgi:acyl carrier protein
MQSPEERLAKLCELAAEQAQVDVSTVNASTNLFTDLNFDSLDAVEFTMQIEDTFDVSIPDEAAESVKTIGDAAKMLEEHRKG